MRALRYVSRNKEPVDFPPGASGDKMWIAEPWPDRPYREADLYGQDGAGLGESGSWVVTRESLGYASREYTEDPPEVFFRWPAGEWTRDQVLGIGVRVRRLHQGYLFRLAAVEEAARGQPFELAFWHPRFKLGRSERYAGWIVAWVPARLVPQAGTRMRLELEAFVANEESRARVEAVRIWTRRKTAAPWEEPEDG